MVTSQFNDFFNFDCLIFFFILREEFLLKIEINRIIFKKYLYLMIL